jgi:superfamily I DNA/RNA helicase
MEGRGFFGAYNKAAAQEIRDRVEQERSKRRDPDFGKKFYIATVHAACFSAWRQIYPKVEVDDRKVGNLITRYAEEIGDNDGAVIKQALPFISKMVSFGKQYLIGVLGKFGFRDLDKWFELVEHFSADEDLPEGVDLRAALEWVITISMRSKELCREIIDFNDMIYAPLAFKAHFFQNDWVLLDECQDINPARREAARRMLKPGGRFVGVGDDRQAVYGFTGAGADSIDRIAEEFGCIRLPLTVSYRCPKTVVNYAHQWVQHIQAHESAPEGVVREVKIDKLPASPDHTPDQRPWFLQDAVGNADAILCRYTAPLIKTAYSMIKEGVACRVEGRDIGQGLAILAKRWKVKTLDKLAERLEQHRKREVEKARAAGSERREQEVEDKIATLFVIIDRCHALGKHTVLDMLDEIALIFADNVKGTAVLCTGHKAKGREWSRVYWILPKTGGRRSRKDWEQIQESNLCYVICTRAKSELVLVPEP